MSKNFYDDEILFVYENGDIHLKEGVKRLFYDTDLQDESYINNNALLEEKINKFLEVHSIEDSNEDI